MLFWLLGWIRNLQGAEPRFLVFTDGSRDAFCTRVEGDTHSTSGPLGVNLSFAVRSNKIYVVSGLGDPDRPAATVWDINTFTRDQAVSLAAQPVLYLGPPAPRIALDNESKRLFFLCYADQKDRAKTALAEVSLAGKQRKHSVDDAFGARLSATPNGVLLTLDKGKFYFIPFHGDAPKTFQLTGGISSADDQGQTFPADANSCLYVTSTKIARFTIPDRSSTAVAETIYTAPTAVTIAAPHLAHGNDKDLLFFKRLPLGDRSPLSSELSFLDLKDNTVKDITLKVQVADYLPLVDSEQIVAIGGDRTISTIQLRDGSVRKLLELPREVFYGPTLGYLAEWGR